VVERVLVRRKHVRRSEIQPGRDLAEKAARRDFVRAVVEILIGDQARLRPDGLAVAAPIAVERPARQLLAGIPLALSEVRQSRRRIPILHALEQGAGEPALRRTHRGRVPFRTVRIVDGHERGFAAHRQPHVHRRKIGIDRSAEALNGGPLGLAVGLRDARRLPDAAHAHVMFELGLAFIHAAADGRRRRGFRAASEG
jgi:hypothetical protein